MSGEGSGLREENARIPLESHLKDGRRYNHNRGQPQ